MNKMVGTAIRLVLLVAVVTLLAVYAWGQQYYSLITPCANFSLLEKIDGDRWMHEGATVRLPHLASRGTILDVQFQDWHPANQAPPHVQVKVCGKLASAFTVQAPYHFPVYLRGDCEPRTVEFHFQNVFQAAPDDDRIVGAQLHSLSLRSKLGVPLVAEKILASTVGAILLLLLLLRLAVQQKGVYYSLTAAVLILSYYLISNATFFSFGKLLAVYVAMLLLLSGATLARKVQEHSIVTQLGRRSTHGLLLLILIVAAALRLTGLSFGLPHIYHPDEYQKYLAVVRMASYGDLNPRYFLHPSLLLYSTYGMNFLVQTFSDWSTWDASIIFAGRIVSCLAGTLSVGLLFYSASRMLSPVSGLIASAFLAVFPIHVTCSRYVKEDALLTFFVLLTLALVTKAAKTQRGRYLLGAGIAAGLASSVKYSGLLCVMILWGYPWLAQALQQQPSERRMICNYRFLPSRRFFILSFIASVLVPVGFILGTPYSILDSAKFVSDFNSERGHMISGHSSAITAASQYWTFHLRHSLLEGVGGLALSASLVAFGLALRRFVFPGLYILALFLLFYLPAEFVRAKPAPQAERYILPCVPFVALALGFLWQFLRTKQVQLLRVGYVILLVLAFSTQAFRSAQLASELRPDTRDTLARWMQENLPPDAKVAIDWRQYGPQFITDPVQIHHFHPTTVLLDLHPEALASGGYDYVVLSSLHYDRYFSQPNIVPAYREVIRTIFRRYPIVYEVEAQHGSYGFHNPKLTVFDLRQTS